MAVIFLSSYQNLIVTPAALKAIICGELWLIQQINKFRNRQNTDKPAIIVGIVRNRFCPNFFVY
jgi:hypothetical protein